MNDKTAFPSDTADKVLVRMPDGMRDHLKAAAKTNNRTMNAEIVARLQQSFAVDNSLANSDRHTGNRLFGLRSSALDAIKAAGQPLADPSFAEQEHARMLTLGGLGSTGSIAAEIQAKMAAEQETELNKLKKMIAAAIAPAMTDFLEEFKEQERKEREKLIEQITGASAIRELSSGKLTIHKKPPKKPSAN
ncbi:MAG: Arc family DNA-binding protein [Simplicispira sp.]|nr:Arc family DNA-binding protein [Simplicispira sp.]